MKKTFSYNDCVICVPSAQIYQAMLDYARSKNVPVYYNASGAYFKEYKNIAFNYELTGRAGNGEGNIISIEQFFNYCDNWVEYQPKEVKLNDSYNAIILYDTVKVGCQEFSFKAIEDLYTAIKNNKY